MNTRYEQERQWCFEKYNKYGLLKALKDEDFKPDLALLLENQRIINEMSNDNDAQFKRVSIPLVCRIMANSQLRKFASVQPLISPNGIVHYFKNNKVVEEAIASTTKKMNATWCFLEAPNNLYKLDAEAELMAILAQELSMEIDRMSIIDMLNYAALKKEIDFDHLGGESINDKWAAVQETVIDLALENQQLYHRPFPNWLIASKEVARAICPSDDGACVGLGLEIHRYGSINTEHGDISVWVDPLFPISKILLGYKGEHFCDAGYIYAPYVMLQLTPLIDEFVPRRGFLSRFGRKLVDSTYYSTLTIKNWLI